MARVFDTTKKYTITSPLLGPKNNLASTLDTDTVIVEPSGLKSSQQWFLTTTSVEGYYVFHTGQKGEEYCLDIRGYDGVDRVGIHFHDYDPEGTMKGQFWTVGNWSDGSARISNQFTGSDVLLTVQKDGDGFKALLADADQNNEGQKWTFNIAGAEPTLSTTLSTAILTSLASTATLSAPTLTGTLTGEPSATASVTPGGGGGGGLSTAAKAGVGVGAVVIAGLLGVAGYFIWKKIFPSHEYTLPPGNNLTTLDN